MRKNNNAKTIASNAVPSIFAAPAPVYVVANRDGRRFLNRPVYTGRATDMWSSLAEAHTFSNRRDAYRCAYDINRRSDARTPFAFVVDGTIDVG